VKAQSSAWRNPVCTALTTFMAKAVPGCGLWLFMAHFREIGRISSPARDLPATTPAKIFC
jgi:hypothetical protein